MLSGEPGPEVPIHSPHDSGDAAVRAGARVFVAAPSRGDATGVAAVSAEDGTHTEALRFTHRGPAQIEAGPRGLFAGAFKGTPIRVTPAPVRPARDFHSKSAPWPWLADALSCRCGRTPVSALLQWLEHESRLRPARRMMFCEGLRRANCEARVVAPFGIVLDAYCWWAMHVCTPRQ